MTTPYPAPQGAEAAWPAVAQQAWPVPTRAERRAEARHQQALQQVYRNAELACAQVATQHAIHMAQLAAEAQRRRAIKMQLAQDWQESQILAGDNPELRAMFSVLDTDYFQALRLREVSRYWDAA